jgi:hypothetical protein
MHARSKRNEARPDRKLRRKGYTLKRRYNLTFDQYQAMMERQNHTCALCEEPFDRSVNNLRPCIDHNHETGKIRAILHSFCNLLIAYARENPLTCFKAGNYLVSHEAVPESINT